MTKWENSFLEGLKLYQLRYLLNTLITYEGDFINIPKSHIIKELKRRGRKI